MLLLITTLVLLPITLVWVETNRRRASRRQRGDWALLNLFLLALVGFGFLTAIGAAYPGLVDIEWRRSWHPTFLAGALLVGTVALGQAVVYIVASVPVWLIRRRFEREIATHPSQDAVPLVFDRLAYPTFAQASSVRLVGERGGGNTVKEGGNPPALPDSARAHPKAVMHSEEGS